MRDPFSKDRFARPERFFDEFLRKGVKGMFLERDEQVPVLYRALVIGVDTEGAKLENPQGTGKVPHNVDGKKYDVPARPGPENPPNSVKARIITDGFDKFTKDDNLRVFWPLFPDALVKPGEHVYVLFEDTNMLHGLWISKVAGHLDVNYSPGKKFYTPASQGSLVSLYPDSSSAQSSQEDELNKEEDAAEVKSGNKLSSLW